jgi:hypothetical protein
VDRDLALVGTIAVPSRRLCGPPHASLTRRAKSRIAATPDALTFAAWGRECVIELKYKRDAALGLAELSYEVLGRADAAPSVSSALDEQLLSLP